MADGKMLQMTEVGTRTSADLAVEVQALVDNREFHRLRELVQLEHPADLAELITMLEAEQRAVVSRLLPRAVSASVFEHLARSEQHSLLLALGDSEVANVLAVMAPDDRTMRLESPPDRLTNRLLSLLSPAELEVATRLLGYPPESIGRLMPPDYVAVKPDWNVREALDHIRLYGRDSETLNVVYVTAPGGRLIADIRMRELLLVSPETPISELIRPDFTALSAVDDQEEAVRQFSRLDRSALPVTDSDGVLVGIVTVDDVLDIAQAEATEDIHRMVGSEHLDQPYLSIRLGSMISKRSFWLILLFFGQMLTATAMGRFEAELAQALVLALFVPLIISSGGNSGSQSAALIIRALTMGEIQLTDWLRVLKRELLTGQAIGTILGLLGFLRISVVQAWDGSYGPYWPLVGLTNALSLIGVVLWGSIMGAMLPFILQRLGFDPATSSTPAVATLVDVTGIVLYFSIARIVLSGTLL